MKLQERGEEEEVFQKTSSRGGKENIFFGEQLQLEANYPGFLFSFHES